MVVQSKVDDIPTMIVTRIGPVKVKGTCPYCKEEHTHGAVNDSALMHSPGTHRTAHCSQGKGLGYYIRYISSEDL